MKLLRNVRAVSFLSLAALAVASCGENTPDLPTDADPGIEQVGGISDLDMRAALAIQQRHTPDLLKIEGVVGTGLAIVDGAPRIRVYAVHGNVRGIPAQAENIPVERVVTGRIDAGDLNNPTTRERPAPNGFSIGHPDITAGTLGAVVKDGASVCYALSNNHVLADVNNASIGDNALQPGPFDGGTNPADAIGTLADFEPIQFSGNNTIDGAVAVLTDANLVTAVTPASAYGAPGTSPVGASAGMNVQKFGRTTGHTTGQVSEVGVTVDVCYVPRGPFGCAASARFVNQIGITPGSFSDGGDSGSLIVTNNGSKNPVGLLFAGSSARTLANPITPVLTRFGVQIVTGTTSCSNGGGTPANNAPTAGFSVSTSGLTADFTDQSSDSDGNVVAWSWSFGDGASSSAQNPSHTYASGAAYAVTLTVTDDDGAQDAASQTVTVTTGGSGITLAASGRKVKGTHTIDLTWNGATSTNVGVYRNGSLLATTSNNGAYTDATGNKGKTTYVYGICEAGGSTCSNNVTVQF
jgi:PKD repeat protein